MAEWIKDEGYSCCKTARFGNLAVVICPPDFTVDGKWGYQAFDEGNLRAIENGEIEYDDYGFESEQSVIDYVESMLEN